MSFHNVWAALAAERHGATLWLLIVASLIVGAFALWMLMSVPTKYRKSIVMAVTFLGGLVLALEFLIGQAVPQLTGFMPQYANVQMVIGSFALLLGVLNLFKIHGAAIDKRSAGWANSLAFFIAFFAIVIAGFLKDSSSAAVNQPAGNVYNILFSGFLVPLQGTMFSMIAFYIASAAYRAFKIRSAEAALMMIAAAIIMLSLVPAGLWLTAWLPTHGVLSLLRLENLGHWILVSPNMAVQRAMAFGVAVGGMATGLRIWLSLERGSFFDRQL